MLGIFHGFLEAFGTTIMVVAKAHMYAKKEGKSPHPTSLLTAKQKDSAM